VESTFNVIEYLGLVVIFVLVCCLMMPSVSRLYSADDRVINECGVIRRMGIGKRMSNT
jgi:hypothetical protein